MNLTAQSKIYYKIACLVAMLAATMLALPAGAITPEPLKATREQASKYGKIMDIVLGVIERYHYRDRPVDDKLSKQILQGYIKALDGNRMFFTASNIDDFNKLYGHYMDDAMIAADTEPAFEIFKVYRSQVDKRVKYALSLLPHDFDFGVDESYIYNRMDEPWASTNKDLDKIWAKRIKHEALNMYISGDSKSEIREALQKRYQAIANNVAKLDSDDVFDTFINAFTSAIEPHTSYLSPADSENFDINMRLSLEGIGAVLSNEGSEYTIVQRLVPGGPADIGGDLKPDDHIIGVAQGDASEMLNIMGVRLNDVVNMIRGPRGTVVRLEVLEGNPEQQGATRIVRIVRDQVRLEQRAARSFTIKVDDKLFGVIDIPSFYSDFAAQSRGDKDYRSTARDVRKLLTDLKRQGVEGLIIDLRSNGGGSLREALALTGLFIRDGPLLQTRTTDGGLDISYDHNIEISFSKDLVVLVDRNSASASEIFAGAIQDYRRGIIIGETTFGKGTVQNIINLNEFAGSNSDLGRLKTTIAQYYRITGNSNQYLGVTPDVRLPGPGLDDNYGERAYDNALPWDTVTPLNYVPLNRGVSIEFLRQQHAQRLQEISELVRLEQRARILHERSIRKSVSLLESKRRKEHKELSALREEALADINPDNNTEFESGQLRDIDDIDILLREAGRIVNDIVVSRQQRSAAASY